MMDYETFLDGRMHLRNDHGFTPTWVPDFLFDFQKSLVEWAVVQGRAALFADCGLGKSPMQLVWAENVVRHTGRPVLIVTPLAVSYQVLREAEKFGIDCRRVIDGAIPAGARVVVTNYERLHLFRPQDVGGVVCDESSILKNYDGTRKAIVTEFLRTLPYRLLCTATAAPNDYTELGTSAEALGVMGHMDMLTRFFRRDDGSQVGSSGGARRFRKTGEVMHWRFKKHAEVPFWRWVCSWARAVRRPSDLGFDNGRFVLPKLREVEHVVHANELRDGWLFEVPAMGFHEERAERRRTLTERCDKVTALASSDASRQSLVWCHLNAEADILADQIPGAEQVSGSDSDDDKESRLVAFANGDLRVLVTKPKIGAWGLNLQGCSHVSFFPSHSYEQYYQGVRRCWRFGQTKPVTVDIVTGEGELHVLDNLKRKASAADRMSAELVRHMNHAQTITSTHAEHNEEMPSWLSSIRS